MLELFDLKPTNAKPVFKLSDEPDIPGFEPIWLHPRPGRTEEETGNGNGLTSLEPNRAEGKGGKSGVSMPGVDTEVATVLVTSSGFGCVSFTVSGSGLF